MILSNLDSGTSGSTSHPPFSDSQETKTHQTLPKQEQFAEEMPKEENPVEETPNKEGPTGESQTPEQGTDKAISGEGDEKLQENENQVQEQSDVSGFEEENPIEKNSVKEIPFGENPIQENPTLETQEIAKDEAVSGEEQSSNVSASKQESNPLVSVSKQENSKEITSEEESSTDEKYEVSSYKDDGIEEEEEEEEEEEGFNFRHLQVLQNMPISAFYGVDLFNLSELLKPLENCKFYGNDEDSLAAENAKLDEFYANRNRVQAVCENDLLLFPESKTEEEDDETTLMNLIAYKQECGTLPYFLDQPLPRLGEQRPLLAHINSYIKKGGCISQDRLMDKVLKLQIKYKNLVEKKGENPNDQDFTSSVEENFFSLSRSVWEQKQDSDVNRGGVNQESNVCAEANFNVDQEVAAKSKCEEAVSKDQDQEMFLFPESTSEEEDDITTLRILLSYKQVAGLLTSFDDQRHPLLRLINSYSYDGKQGPITGPRLADKLLKLQIRYKMLLEELGENPADEEISKHSENLFFQLSRRMWGKGSEL